jgi:hypothetical protein
MLEILDPTAFGSWIAIALFVGILAFLAVGRWIGRRIMARHHVDALPSVGSLEAAVFALLGLLIAFTFSGALARFDVRRAQVVDEANAIGTAYLRVDLLPAPAQPKLRDTFRDYVDSRIATYRKLPDLDAAKAELARSQTLQSAIWSQAVAAVRLPEAPAGLEITVLPALNSMFDITTVRVAATQMHPPTIIYIMLVGLALASALLAGYQAAGQTTFDWIHGLGFAVVVSLTLFVILDIEYPRLGFVRIDAIDQLLVNVRAGMN